MGLAAFLLRRLLGLVGVLLGMSVLIFSIVHILPGNVAYAILGEFATPADRKSTRLNSSHSS